MPVWLLPGIIGAVIGFIGALVLNNNKKAVESKVTETVNKI